MHKPPARILVSVPHAGTLAPREISPTALSDHQQELALDNVDWYTDRLYDLRGLLPSRLVTFPFSQVYINVNRHPRRVDESAPTELGGLPIYKDGCAPSFQERRVWIRKYHSAYHRSIAHAEKSFILDGHSTVTGHADAAGNRVTDDIIVSDWQKTPLDPPDGLRTAPPGFLDTYADELELRLKGSGIGVARNTTYASTYGHVMARHGWDGRAPRGRRAPLLLQETNEALYVRDGVMDVLRVEELRRVFAESILAMLRKMGIYGDW